MKAAIALVAVAAAAVAVAARLLARRSNTQIHAINQHKPLKKQTAERKS